ncbi:MAG: hypothetical protein A2Y67_03870 [Candidatus Buchananbacteria bacterium RBG_13_39_9]|uniref:Fibronectin type-III domain-containing protein n=1 Tax=Candidatus Buchananbacteria bacterium RBG_13_39_9 TaxID=1797531 RepID=A0A1G1XPC0_9BACT|nr:MAG: hypothetical protein A2Y67_03870 [Candidatus Buchananbacteria bacterium RBG_13_39_9]
MGLPTVTTEAVSDIAPTTAQANGTITDTGGSPCSLRGFVFGLASHGDPGNIAPAVSAYENSCQQRGTFSYGGFDIELSALVKNTTYYVRVWARNNAGYSYGDEVNFDTLEGVYPGALYSPRTKINKVGVNYDSAETTTLFAPDVTKLDDEVVAIETELGINVKGGHADLKARLEWIESQLP